MGNNVNSSKAIANHAEKLASGKSLRESVPRSSHAKWDPPKNRPDLVAFLEESNRDRIPALIPLRHSRMLKSPLACFRGSAGMMADDLAGLPKTGLRIQICGDCHVHNFGWFASPERNLIFDINDFDETRNAPWEWDIKRLVVSAVLAARSIGAAKSNQRNLVQSIVREYRERLAAYTGLPPLEMWYQRLDAQVYLTHVADLDSIKRAQRTVESARQRTVDRILPGMIGLADGNTRFLDRPPLVFHPANLEKFLSEIRDNIHVYRTTLLDERRQLLERYKFVDAAYKIVGVGSVGLRCGIILMHDCNGSPLVLQIKEARASVLEKHVGPSERRHHGHRIVHGQRLMQAASDLFLGWSDDSSGRGYYFRQLRDMKLSLNVERMSLKELEEYGQLCGWALARAHAKSDDCSMITGYLGSGDSFDQAIGDFGLAYASQVESDFEQLQKAAKAGRITVMDESQVNLTDFF